MLLPSGNTSPALVGSPGALGQQLGANGWKILLLEMDTLIS